MYAEMERDRYWQRPRQIIAVFALCLLCAANIPAKIIYVAGDAAGTGAGASWANAMTRPQDAIGIARKGDEVWIKAGTYKPTHQWGEGDPRAFSFHLRNNVSVYGGFAGTETSRDQRDVAANETIFSGDLGVQGDTSDNAYHVFYHPKELSLDNSALLDSVTIVAGNADDYTEHRMGAGMSNEQSSPMVSDCRFLDNTALDGAGMYNKYSFPVVSDCFFSGNVAWYGAGMYNDTCLPILSACLFKHNSAQMSTHSGRGGGLYNRFSPPILVACEFLDNSAGDRGGGMYNYRSPSTVEQCSFSGNVTFGDGGGMYNYESPSTVEQCSFSGNVAFGEGGGMKNKWSSVSLGKCCFVDNSARSGGAIYNDDSSATVIEDCAFLRNRSTGSGGAIHTYQSDPSATGCVFSGNSADEYGGAIYVGEGSSLTVTNTTCAANSARCGGGIYSYSASLSLVHCTVSGNTACWRAAISVGRIPTGGSVSIANSIIWGNVEDGNDGCDVPGLGGRVTHCIVEGGYAQGVAIMDADPMLRPLHDNGGNTLTFALVPDSPAIDAGTSDDTITTDQRGVTRPQGDGSDLGAFEYHAPIGAWIDVSPQQLDFGRVAHGLTSLPLLYQLRAAGLDEPVTVSPPAHFSLSTDGNTYGDEGEAVTVLPVDGLLDTEISVRFLPSEAATCSGLISHVSGALREVVDVTGVGDGARVVYVSQSGDDSTGASWATALHDPQLAIQKAAVFDCYGTEVWVAAGVYNPTHLTDIDDPRTASFELANNVAVYGGFGGHETRRDQRSITGNESIFSGNIGVEDDAEDNSYHVFYHPRELFLNRSAVLDGVTISCGNADGIAATTGGGMYNSWASPTVRNCIFLKNRASSDGGGMWNDASSPVVNQCVFQENDAYGGGGVYARASSFDVTACRFTGNEAGGGMDIENCYAVLSNCTFTGNSVGVSSSNSSVEALCCTFSANSAGALSSSTSSVDISGCTFADNSGEAGGALYSYHSYPDVTDSTFAGNTAGLGGAVFACYGSRSSFRDCVFSDNTAHNHGGAIRDTESTLSVVGCEFRANTADEGGAVYSCDDTYTYQYDSSLSVIDSVFAENMATVGGGIWRHQSASVVTGCTFSKNYADVDGGGLMCGGGRETYVGDCSFTENRAGATGGGMIIVDCSATVTGSTFASNASANGGGIYSDSSLAMLTNCTLVENTAGGYGGGIRCVSSDLSLIHCTLYNNRAERGCGLAITGWDESSVIARNSIFWGERWPEAEIYHGGHYDKLGVTACIVRGGYADGRDVLDVDPELLPLHCDGSGPMTLPLRAGSPAIDAGDDVGVPETDQRGVLRPQGNGADIGAFEYDGMELPYIEASVKSLDFGHVAAESSSLPLSYRLCGAKLAETISVCPPSEFAISADGVTWGDCEEALVLQTVDGALNTTVHVRFNPSAEEEVSGEIIHTSGDVSVSVGVSGSGNVSRVLRVSLSGDNSTGASWETAFHDLQQTIEMAAAFDCQGTEVWVQAGTYKPTRQWEDDDARAVSFQLHNHVAVYGGFSGNETLREQRDPTANETVLSGDIGVEGDASDNAYHVLYHPSDLRLNASAVIDGFTVALGTSLSERLSESGGGMYNNHCSPTVVNCVFRQNRAFDGSGMWNKSASPTVRGCTFLANGHYRGYGGGMLNTASSPIISDCVFAGNSSGDGGGLCNTSAWPSVSRCRFTRNQATGHGGGVFNNVSSADFSQCSFERNSGMWGWGGGVRNSGSKAIFTYCSFTANGAFYGGGGMLNDESSVDVRGCTFSGNSADYGGGMLNDESPVEVRGCTFSGNSADHGGGVMNEDSTTIALMNCTFWGNKARGTAGGMETTGSNVSAVNCTFSGNVAASAGAVWCLDGNLDLVNCVLWDNSDSNLPVSSYDGCYSVNVSNCVVEGGYPDGTNIITDDPLLGELQDNSGPTQTIAISADSPARDAGLADGAPETDQRGYQRDGAPDIGAYEVEGRRPYSVQFDVDGVGWLSGDVLQTVYEGGDSTPVTVHTGAGDALLRWSTGSTDNPLVLTNVTADATAVAVVVNALSHVNAFASGSSGNSEVTAQFLRRMGVADAVDGEVDGYRLALQDIGYIDNADILQQVIDAVNQEHGMLKIYVRDGWNLLSSPFAGWSPSSVLSVDQILGVQGYRRGSYYTMPSAAAWVPGAGYWLQLGGLAQDETPIIISGQVMNDTTIPVTDGWNLIGPIVDTPTVTMDYVEGHPMAWDAENGQYVSAGDILYPGTGYWGRIDSAVDYVGRPEITAVVFDHDAGTVSIEVGSLNSATVRIRVCDAASGSTAADVLSRVNSGVGTVVLGTEQGLEIASRHIYTIEVSAVRNGIRGDWVGGRYFSGAGGTEAAESFVNTDLMAAGFDWETLMLTDLDTGGAAVEYTAIVLDATGLPTAVQESRTVPDAATALDLGGVTAGSGDTLYIKIRLVDPATGAPKTDWRTFSP